MTSGPGPVEDWADAPSTFASLDAAGCSGIWLADHLFWGSPMPECFVMAAVATAATSSCRVGTGVVQLPLRRSAAVAKAAATLQTMSRGRFVLGVGSGEHAQEYARVGVDYGQRGSALDAAISEIRSLWSDPDGWYGQRPSPGTVPVWVGGKSARALARAAGLADGWMPIFLTAEGFSSANDDLDARLRRADRPADSVTRAPVAIVAATDQSWRRDDALGWMVELWGADAARLDRFLITGSAGECAEQLAEYHASGADQVVTLMANDHPARMFVDLNDAYRSIVSA